MTASGGFAGTGGGTADVAAPGQFRSMYYGKFVELPVGTVRAQGWVKAWLQRQDDGLTGHPENLAYPYNTGMYAVGKIPPPAVSHGEDWWRYEQSGYFVDAVSRMSRVIDAPNASKIADANVAYLNVHSGPAKLGESTFTWPNTVVGRALMAAYSNTTEVAAPRALNSCVQKSNSVGYRDGYIAEEAFYLYGLTADTKLLSVAKNAYTLTSSTIRRRFRTSTRSRGRASLSPTG